MTIAISGTSSTGKTTLLQKLNNSYFESYAKSLLIDLNWNLNNILKSQKTLNYFHEMLLYNKIKNETSNNYDYVERSTIDFYIFYKSYCLIYDFDDKFLNDYYRRCVEYHYDTYSSWIYLKNTPILKQHHLRITDNKFIDIQKKLYKIEIKKHPIVLVHNTTLDLRLKFIKSIK